MTAENSMQNPGDLRVPEGVVIKPAKKILIVNNGTASLVERSNFDEVVELGGSEPSENDEQKTLAETTYPI